MNPRQHSRESRETDNNFWYRFVPNLLEYVYANNYFNTKRLDICTVTAKIKGRSLYD